MKFIINKNELIKNGFQNEIIIKHLYIKITSFKRSSKFNSQ